MAARSVGVVEGDEGQLPYRRALLYITDGGGFENLGFIEALRRRPAEVFCFDASGEKPGSFTTLGRAIALARTDLGVELSLDPAEDGAGMPQVPYLAGKAVYPDGGLARVWYVKAMVSPGAPWDVQAYARGHPKFPHNSTGQQFHDEQEFEAYRCLGQDAVGRLLDARAAASRLDLTDRVPGRGAAAASATRPASAGGSTPTR